MKQDLQSGDSDPRSILVVLPTWVGDFVMATPTLRAIRSRFTDAHITFLINPNLGDLVHGGDWMNECIEWPKNRERKPARGLLSKVYRDFVWDLRRRRFDWAVLLPNSFRAALTARLAGAKRRFGYDRDGRGLLLTDRLTCQNLRNGSAPRRSESGPAPYPSLATTAPVTLGKNIPGGTGRYLPIPLVEYYADLAEAMGCDRPGDQLELFTTPDCDQSVASRLSEQGISDHHPLVVLSPGARYGAAKCWLPERFAAVADRLVEREGAAVVITCGPGEEPIAAKIGSAMRRNHVGPDSPRFSLGELKSLIRRCDLLICNDAGPRHLAKAFGVAVVTIFGPTHPDWTATDYTAERIVRVDVECGPCQQRVCPLGHLNCITGVTVDAVYGACQDLLTVRAVSRVSEETATGPGP